MRVIDINKAECGMILARDIYATTQDLLLLKKGVAITEANIADLKAHHIRSIFVCNGRYDNLEMEPLINNALRDKVVKEMYSVYQTNALNELTLGPKEMERLSAVTDMIVDQVVSSPFLSVSVKNLQSFDEYTYHHCLCVSALSVAIASALDLDRDTMRRIGLSALLHDVGKIQVGLELINKPGKFTQAEFELVKKHPLYGAEYLKKNNLVDFDIYNGVLTHHEKYDGSGYPFGLAGGNIPLFGRILAVADVYDALTSNRPYRTAKSPSEAYEFLLGGVDTHFDPDMVKAFSKRIAPYPIGMTVDLSNGDKGLVVDVDPETPLRPIISSLVSGDMYDLRDAKNSNITILGELVTAD